MKDFLENVLFWILVGIGTVITIVMGVLAILAVIVLVILHVGVALMPTIIMSEVFDIGGWKLFWHSLWIVPLWVLYLISSQKNLEDRLFH